MSARSLRKRTMQILQNGELLTIIPLSSAERAEWTLANVKKWLVAETGKIRSEHLPPGFAGDATVPESVVVFLDSESMEPLPDSTRVEDIGCTAVLLLKGLAAVQPEMATKLEAIERAYRKLLDKTVLDEAEQEVVLDKTNRTNARWGAVRGGKFVILVDIHGDDLSGRGHWSEEIVVEGVGGDCIFRGITKRGRQSIEKYFDLEFADDGITVARNTRGPRVWPLPGWKLYDIRVNFPVDDKPGQRVSDLTKWTQCVETGGSVSGPDRGSVSGPQSECGAAVQIELRFSPVDPSPALIEEFRTDASVGRAKTVTSLGETTSNTRLVSARFNKFCST